MQNIFFVLLNEAHTWGVEHDEHGGVGSEERVESVVGEMHNIGRLVSPRHFRFRFFGGLRAAKKYIFVFR